MRSLDRTVKPQFIVFSATMPHWVHKTTKKYMSKDFKIVDLVQGNVQKTSATVEVNLILFLSSFDDRPLCSTWLCLALIMTEQLSSMDLFRSIRVVVQMDVQSSSVKRRKKQMNFPLVMISKSKPMFFMAIFHRINVNWF